MKTQKTVALCEKVISEKGKKLAEKILEGAPASEIKALSEEIIRYRNALELVENAQKQS